MSLHHFSAMHHWVNILKDSGFFSDHSFTAGSTGPGDGNTADVIHLYFAKEFDSVNHGFLLAKLESFGLCDIVVRWIRSYLTGRTNRVQVDDALPQATRIKIGVPQGSVIGPRLLLLLVNDLQSFINVATLLSADDVKVVSRHLQSDRLQGSHHNVWNWSVNWDFPINPTKCNYIAIGRAHPLQLSLATWSPGNSIQVANVGKDLGVLKDHSLSPSLHWKEAASKARRMLFMIRRSLAELSVLPFGALYNKLVKPHLEYAMQACSPNFIADADCLEKIQRLATRLIMGSRRLPCEERLRQLSLHSLRRRHLCGDLKAVYKMLSGRLDLDPNLFFIPPVRPGLRGHPFKVLQGPSRRLRRKSS